MTGPLPYIGGKHRIANRIVAIFPEHTTYVEAFAGGAQVLFHKSKKTSKAEVLNDLDHDIVNFFRICQLHYGELLRYLKFVLVSRRWFSLFESENPETLTDVQRAARMFYLQKNAYAGLVRRRTYMHSVVCPRPFNPARISELIENAHRRLERVQIECLPYEQVLAHFDRPETLFYLDPPYWGRSLYRFNFAEADFKELAERLRVIRGKFVLSLNDLPEVREVFRGFRFREIAFAYSAQQAPGKRYRELLITNFS